MDSPGYDPASVTGQIASGCNLVVFTTGRGSAFGSKPSPTIKVATNTEMYDRMIEDMDINAGTILTDGRSVQEVGREIYDMVLRVASGEASKSGQREQLWRRSVSTRSHGLQITGLEKMVPRIKLLHATTSMKSGI